MRFYLGGPINGCTDAEANGWRQEVIDILRANNQQWIDPMVRDYRGRELEPGIAAEIVELDKQDIDQCDVLLMNCPKPSVGTSMEVYYGWDSNKVVWCIIPEGSKPSPWLSYHSTEIHEGSIVDLVRSWFN